MAAGSRGSRKVAGGNRLRTALACVGAVACVAASASGDPAFDATAAPTHQTQPASTRSATPAGRQATPAMFVRAPAMPTLGNVGPFAAELGVLSADAEPSWVDEAAPQGARGGERAARRLSAEVLKGTAPSGISSSALGIPGIVLTAYHRAADEMARQDPSCGVSWWLLAGIGRIESGHASGGRVDANGTTLGRILGPRLDGSMAGNAVIHDSDGGAFDGDPHFDRAVGPMQFLPGTWASVRSDGNGDGVSNPNNVYDATLGAARYLCLGGADLRTPGGLTSAVLRYNNSMDYVRSVLTWGQAYRDGEVAPVKSATGRVPAAVNPRQLPVEPPRSHSTKNTPKKSTPKKSAASPDKSRSDNPTRQTNSQDKPPVLADGPRQQPDRKGQPSSGSTPRPPSTVAPSNGGGTKQGDKRSTGGKRANPKSGDTGATKGSSTPPSATSTNPPPTTGTPTTPPTIPPTTGTPIPTDPPPTGTPGPTVHTADPGEAWTVSSPSGTPAGSSHDLTTPGGTFTVSHTILPAPAKIDHDGTPTTAHKDERFWVVKVKPLDGASSLTWSVQSGVTTTAFDAQPSGPTYLAVSVQDVLGDSGAGVVLTATSDDGTWTIDVGAGTTTTTWARTADIPVADQQLTGSTATTGDSTAKPLSLQLGQAHLTTWEPGYPHNEDTKWLVLPYTLDSADSAELHWVSGGLIAAGAHPATLDGSTATLKTGSGQLVFKVPAATTDASIQIGQGAQAVKDGAAPTTVTFDSGLDFTLTFG